MGLSLILTTIVVVLATVFGTMALTADYHIALDRATFELVMALAIWLNAMGGWRILRIWYARQLANAAHALDSNNPEPSDRHRPAATFSDILRNNLT